MIRHALFKLLKKRLPLLIRNIVYHTSTKEIAEMVDNLLYTSSYRKTLCTLFFSVVMCECVLLCKMIVLVKKEKQFTCWKSSHASLKYQGTLRNGNLVYHKKKTHSAPEIGYMRSRLTIEYFWDITTSKIRNTAVFLAGVGYSLDTCVVELSYKSTSKCTFKWIIFLIHFLWYLVEIWRIYFS